jgi:DNA-binding response OmpR family regulator
MQILLLESNLSLAQFIENTLKSEAYSCTKFSTHDSFNNFIISNPIFNPNIVILNQNFLPSEISQLVSKLKNNWKNIKILALTDNPGAKDRIKMLELGCDDSMTKPIDINELLLRIKIISQRNQNQIANISKKNWNILLDESSKNIYIAGNRIPLTHKEYILAETFYFNPEKVFSRTLLLDIAWDSHKEADSNVVEATISGLRKKFHTHKANVIIKSRRNMGYWLESISTF